jgi:hypothetical protein
MNWSWGQRRALLAKERRWIDEYVPSPPALRARDLVQGHSYFAVWRHRPGCMLFAGWRCGCRPDIRFYCAEPTSAQTGPRTSLPSVR